MVDINKLIDEVVGQVAAEEQSAPTTTEPTTVPTEPQPTAQSAQAPVAPVTPTPPPAPSVHSVGDMPISHPTPTEDAIQPQSVPTSVPPRQYVPSAHSIGDMPISRPSSYFVDEDADADEDTHTDTVPPSTEPLYPDALSSGEVPTEQPVAGSESGQAPEQAPEQDATSGQPELVDMDGVTPSGAGNPDDPTAQYDTERYNVPRSYQEALRILDLQRSKPIYQSLMEGLGDPDAKRRAINAYQARRNRYSGLVRLAEAIANTIDASGAQRNAYSERRDPSYRYENDTQRELARQYADLQRTEGMLYNARMRDAARYDRLSAEMRATESAGDQVARNEARYKQQLRQRAADAKRAEEQAKAAAEERAQRAADANAKWQAEMAMRDKQHRDRMGIERAKLAIRRNEQALKAARATAGGTKSSGTGGKGTTTVYKRIPITLSDRVNGHISVPKDSPDYARKFFADNFIESAHKQMEVYNRHHAGDGKTYTSLPEYVQDQYGIDVMPLIGDVQCTPKEYQVAADKVAAIAMRDPETVLSYSVNSPFFGDNGYDADGVQVATDAIRERCGGYLNAISILNAANKSGLTYPQAFAIMYPNIYNSVVSAAQSGKKADLAGVVKVLADGYNGVTYCRNYKDASQMVSWLLDADALAQRAPGFTEEDWGQ